MAWRRELGCSLCTPLETSLCPELGIGKRGRFYFSNSPPLKIINRFFILKDKPTYSVFFKNKNKNIIIIQKNYFLFLLEF